MSDKNTPEVPDNVSDLFKMFASIAPAPEPKAQPAEAAFEESNKGRRAENFERAARATQAALEPFMNELVNTVAGSHLDEAGEGRMGGEHISGVIAGMSRVLGALCGSFIMQIDGAPQKKMRAAKALALATNGEISEPIAAALFHSLTGKTPDEIFGDDEGR